MKLSAHADGIKIRGCNVRFAMDSQVCKQASDGDPRAGAFHQTYPIVGDTACSVKRV